MPHYREYEDLSSYEEEDKALVVAPQATKKQAARHPGAKAGKKSPPAKTPPPPTENHLVKAMVVHGVPCQRPLADHMQEVGAKGVMGAQ